MMKKLRASCLLLFSTITTLVIGQTPSGNVGIGTNSPQGKLHINHKSTTSIPSIYLLDSADGKGSSIQFAKQNMTQKFAITGGLSGPESSRGIILSWIDDSLLWVKNDGRLGLGTGNPLAKMQVNHRSSSNSPSLAILDSMNGLGPSIRFRRQGLDSFFNFSAGFEGPESKRGMILSWLDDSLLWVKSNGRMGLGTGNPEARMQINHKSTHNSPSLLILDSITGKGSSIQFRKQGNPDAMFIMGDWATHEVGHAMIMGWRDDSLLWVRDNGRIGIGTGNPQARMQINHKSTTNSPSFAILDSINGLGPSMRFQRLGLDSFFTFSAGFDGPSSKRGMILSWIDDSLLWVKSDGRLGLGTGNPLAKMQVNHRGNSNSPSLLLLDSSNNSGSSLRFSNIGINGFSEVSGLGMELQFSRNGQGTMWLKPNGAVGIGTHLPTARLQVNHRSSSQSPSLLMLDSINGLGPAIRFQREGLDSFFTFSAGFEGPASKRGMILSYKDDSLLWVKSDGRFGLGTGNPLAKMQVNHKGTNLFPHFVILDSIGGIGSMLSFRKQGELKDLKMTGIPGATRADMKFKIDSLIAFTNNRMGIFTEDPQYEIDLNGHVNIAKSLLLNGSSGQAGQFLRSNGAAGPPTWAYPDTVDIDTIAFKAFSNIFSVNGGATGTVSSTTEKYDIGNVHNPSTGITTISVQGQYLVTVRGSFTTNSTETGPFLLKVILEVLANDNSLIESIEQSSPLPGGLPSHTSNVLLNTQLQLQTGQKLRVKVSNTRPVGGVNSRLDEFSAVLL